MSAFEVMGVDPDDIQRPPSPIRHSALLEPDTGFSQQVGQPVREIFVGCYIEFLIVHDVPRRWLMTEAERPPSSAQCHSGSYSIEKACPPPRSALQR
ncbi:hypothetical protein [Thermogemmata fonticola]|uniref:Uncharacterized protein n=1 Tax=Thermogemmata fonticola TaxID=2755323 RepID=A0A7V8VG96_9BACT|nr:hypothetical protein [Thermogemmata fonticola]MBA2227504.1 hypothetical protein [Thermogemmata fonticola]